MGSHRASRRGPRRDGADPVARRTHGTRSAQSAAGRRRASRRSASRGPLFRGLPSVPVLLGVAALSISAGGAVTVGEQDLTQSSGRVLAASALGGVTGQSSSDLLHGRRPLSRDARRDDLAEPADAGLVAEAEQMTQQRNQTLAQFAKRAERQSKKLELNQWVLPVTPAITTAEFGDYGLWASYHTGLDFNGVEGQPISSVTNGVVTFVGYDGSYGNKTVVTLDDGTELWYCHQSATEVSEGDEVHSGELIGYIGSTGHVTGSHLHFEVRPGGGDPVDPRAAFEVHGVTP